MAADPTDDTDQSHHDASPPSPPEMVALPERVAPPSPVAKEDEEEDEDEVARPGPAPTQAEAEAAAAEAMPETNVVEATPKSALVDAPASPITTFRQRHARSNSFQRFRRQVQRAWRWGSSGNSGELLNSSIREQALRATNLELMANQKRQWYRIKSTAVVYKEPREPMSLFEHFVIVGLHSHANVEAIEDAFAKRKVWESEVSKSEILDLRKLQYHGCMPTLEPQILFKYPPGKRVAMKESELPAFCFPEGVKFKVKQATRKQ